LSTKNIAAVLVATSALLAACDKKAAPAPPPVSQAEPAAVDAAPDAAKAPDALTISHIRAAIVRDAALHVEIQIDTDEYNVLDAAPEEQVEVVLGLDTPLLPDAEHAPVRYTILTPQGPVVAPPVRGAFVARAGVPHIEHVSDLPPGLAGDDKPHVAVLASGPLPATARSRAPELVDVQSEEAAPIVKYVRAQIARSEEDPSASSSFDPSVHLSIARGRFGGDKTLLVIYSIPFPEGSEGEQMASNTSAMLLCDATCASAQDALSEPTNAFIELEQLVDLEGDGVDEAVYTFGLYEGFARYVFRLKDGAPDAVLLSADGA
jgi:hypothetical protein